MSEDPTGVGETLRSRRVFFDAVRPSRRRRPPRLVIVRELPVLNPGPRRSDAFRSKGSWAEGGK
jgi:hypothetical protein